MKNYFFFEIYFFKKFETRFYSDGKDVFENDVIKNVCFRICFEFQSFRNE